VLEEQAGSDGLTQQASTFTRTDVVDALAKRLPVAPSAQAALTEAEDAADRFLEERAVRVTRDRRLGVERFSTPELLALEWQLVDGATKRAEQGCAVVRPELVRQVLDRRATAGEDQAAMVRDLTQGGAGVAVVVGRAGSGKTWTLGLAREAFELDGYRVLGTAPTGIATVGLADEGFTDARTIDRLLLDLGRGREELDARGVLVVDEAAMVATRKLTPLLQHAGRAGAKVVLVGDDHQFASIQAGGGFRALRLRLGASELTVALADHALRTTTGQADQGAERLGVLRRAQQRHLGWMEAHDEELRLQERALARELGWRGRVDQRALVLDPPGWLVAEVGPVPSDPRERAVWRTAAAELDAYRRAYGLDHPGPAEHGGGGRPGPGGRPPRLRPPPPSGTPGPASSGSAAAMASALMAEATSGGDRP
jgi:ATP-dependent exoDNAse (exonuclease V) alpha subunit